MILPSEALRRAAEDTFANLAFMFPAGEAGEGQGEVSAWRAVALSFTGPLNGKLAMKVSDDLPVPIAANMLGLDDETPTAEQQADALRELLNVICGNMLPILAGSEEVFDVGAPAIVDAAGFEIQDPIRLWLEGGVAELSLVLT